MQIQRRTFLAMTAAFCLSGIRAHAAEDNIIGVWSSETAPSRATISSSSSRRPR